jgi:hypothetical protein
MLAKLPQFRPEPTDLNRLLISKIVFLKCVALTKDISWCETRIERTLHTCLANTHSELYVIEGFRATILLFVLGVIPALRPVLSLFKLYTQAPKWTFEDTITTECPSSRGCRGRSKAAAP